MKLAGKLASVHVSMSAVRLSEVTPVTPRALQSEVKGRHAVTHPMWGIQMMQLTDQLEC